MLTCCRKKVHFYRDLSPFFLDVISYLLHNKKSTLITIYLIVFNLPGEPVMFNKKVRKLNSFDISFSSDEEANEDVGAEINGMC